MTTKKISLKELAKLAIIVQDASNFTGVAHSLSHEIIPNVRDAVGENYHRHPVVQLFLFKLYGLSVRDCLHDQDLFSKAYNECKRLAEIDDGQPASPDTGSTQQGQ